ncbi:MAG: hypothetical protein ABI192_08695 [Bradyrhizobium sp.]
MNAMTYSEDLLGTAAGQKLSSGPPESDALPKLEHAATSFQRPGPDVLSRAIAVVFIGRNRDGVWVARDADGKFGGLFWRKSAALRFARVNAAPAGCAAVFPQARFELDLGNSGNPFPGHLGAVKRWLMRPTLRLTAMIRKLARSRRPI